VKIENIKKNLDRYWPVNVVILILAGFLLYLAFTRSDLVMAILAGIFIVTEIIILLVVDPMVNSLAKNGMDYSLYMHIMDYVKINYPSLIFLILLLYIIILESGDRLASFSPLHQQILEVLLIGSFIFASVVNFINRNRHK